MDRHQIKFGATNVGRIFFSEEVSIVGFGGLPLLANVMPRGVDVSVKPTAPAHVQCVFMSSSDSGFVYILASKPNGTLYIGVTGDIVRRVHQHRTGEGSDFVDQYDVTRLVHVERFDDIKHVIRREKQLKAWKREWKRELIRDHNPQWHDLYEEAGRTYVA